MMMRRSVFAVAIAAALACTGLASPASAVTDPSTFISQLGSRALAMLGEKNITAAERRARFHQLFQEDFDLPVIGQFVLGRYWRIATPQQQQEFLNLFDQYITLTYSSRLSEYSGEQFRVIGGRPNGSETIVASQIIRPNGAPPVKVDWHVISDNGTDKITDVVVEGISMAVTQRSEFASVIQRNGGQVESLLSLMRQKVSSTH